MDLEIFDLLISQQVAFATDGKGNITLTCEAIRKLLNNNDAVREEEVEVIAHKKKQPKPIDRGKVFALHNAGWANNKIADEMGCSNASVSNILKGK